MTTTYYHALIGTYEGLDTWVTGIHSFDPTNSVPSAHTVWLQAVGELWAPGSAGNAGWASVCAPGVVATKAVTYSLLPFSLKKTGKTETSLSLAGTALGDAIPPTVAPMVLLDELGQLGRHSGRMYLPPPSTQRWDTGRLDDPAWPTLTTCVQKALLKMLAGGLHPCTIETGTGDIHGITDIRASNKCAVRKSRDDAPPLYQTAHVFP